MTTENTDQPLTEAAVDAPSSSGSSTTPSVTHAALAATPVVSRKPKKKLIQVAGNPQFAPAISRNKEIPNPTTNSVDWAHMPALTTSGITFPAGPIRLRYGEHLGHERGFGLTHIWEARKYKSPAMPTPMDALVEIEKFIMSILQVGTEIFYEGNRATTYDRAMVFKTKVGTVIVEERVDGNGNAWYSIVTAIPRTSAKGILIGNL
jgi:hypothetical protein